MTNAQFILSVLNKQDMVNVVAFMKEYNKATLADAIDWLYYLIFIDGEDCIFERGYDVSASASYASHVRQCSIDTYTTYDWNNIDEIPF